MKKFLWTMVIVVVLFSTMVCSVSAENNEISVYLDAVKIEFDVKPQIINGRTMVPIRAIFEEMDAFVEWDGDLGTAVCTKGDTVVKMTVNSMDMYINNQLTTMDIAPVVIDGRTLAPARYVAEAFGATVQWSQENNAVLILTKDAGEYVLPNETATESTVTLYALDGRTTDVLESEVYAYLNVGWYRTLQETQQTVYAPDGRTMTIYKSEVPLYTNLGWYETQYEAQAANKASNTNKTSSADNSSADGYYYRTPTGKRYHLDPDCGGKNSYRTTNLSGLTPCAKCA